MTATTPIVVGLDLSVTSSGIASSLGWCDTVGAKDVTKLPLASRITAIDSLVGQIYGMCTDADFFIMEAPQVGKAYGGLVERVALGWKLAERLIGSGRTVIEVTSAQRMMYATGKGQADKGAIIDAVARRYPMFETGGNSDMADAVIFMAMGLDWLGHPMAVVPATHRRALAKVVWMETFAS